MPENPTPLSTRRPRPSEPQRPPSRSAPSTPTPSRFGPADGKDVVPDTAAGGPHIAAVTGDNEAAVPAHDAHEPPDPDTAFALSRLADPDTLRRTPIGVLRQVERPVYDTQTAGRLEAAVERDGKGDLAALLAGTDAWTVKE